MSTEEEAALLGASPLPPAAPGGEDGEEWDSDVLSDRYSVAGDPAKPPPRLGLLDSVLTWARGVLKIRCVFSLSEISLTLQPGGRRRRRAKRAPRQKGRAPTLREILEQPAEEDKPCTPPPKEEPPPAARPTRRVLPSGGRGGTPPEAAARPFAPAGARHVAGAPLGRSTGLRRGEGLATVAGYHSRGHSRDFDG